jgi:hypothetical protein
MSEGSLEQALALKHAAEVVVRNGQQFASIVLLPKFHLGGDELLGAVQEIQRLIGQTPSVSSIVVTKARRPSVRIELFSLSWSKQKTWCQGNRHRASRGIIMMHCG